MVWITFQALGPKLTSDLKKYDLSQSEQNEFTQQQRNKEL